MIPLCTHWIPAHRGSLDERTDAGWLADWGPAWVKIVSDTLRPPYTEDVPGASNLLIRVYPVTDPDTNRGFDSVEHAQAVGLQDALAYKQAHDYLVMEKNIDPARLHYESRNEPMLWSCEPPALSNAYLVSFLNHMHLRGLKSVVGNFGVGWPGNGGPDLPPDYTPFAQTFAAMRAGDYWGQHEYWSLNGVDNTMNGGRNMWGWWTGRCLRHNYRVPILITETGIDTNVDGRPYGGWWDLPGTHEEKVARYIGELAWYWNRLREDNRVQGIFTFTYDIGSPHWERFNIRDGVFLRALVQRRGEFAPPLAFGWGQPEEPPKPEPKPEPKPPVFDCYLSRPLPKGHGRVTQWFGKNPALYARFGLAGHNGIDYGVPVGTPVLAAHSGKVETGNDPKGYGLYVRVTDAHRVTLYAHLSAFSVQSGQTVRLAQEIGKSGNTGNSTGPHLHFGLKWLNGFNQAYLGWVDPNPFRR